MNKILSSLLLIISCLTFLPLAQSENLDEILIHLDVKNQRPNVYLAPLVYEKEHETKSYNENVYSIFFFDIDFGGKVNLMQKKDSLDRIFDQNDLKISFSHPSWKAEKADYIVVPKLEKDEISATIFNREYSHIKHLKDLKITLDFTQDLSSIHALSDAVYKAIFNENGIACTKILYSKQTKEKTNDGEVFVSHIWECDYDGRNHKKLSQKDDYLITPIYYPAKSCSPSQFLYVSYENGPSKIFISPLDSFNPEPFLSLRGSQLLPTISRDRSKMAFICDASGRADLFVQALHPYRGLIGKPIQAYSFPSSVQASPTFSPDAKQIAFVSDKENTPRIYIIDTPVHLKNRSLPEARLITKQNRENTCPSWSPDGKKLAYSAKQDGVRQIWIYDFETGEEKPLTKGPKHKENPCWAPDSLHIVFNTATADSSELYIVGLNNSKLIQISDGPGVKHYPCWQP